MRPIDRLREQMKQKKIALYLVPTDDFHGSEYVGDYFKARAYLSGFTGSAGTLVISQEEAGLWTDARYFVQAKQQLANTGIHLYEMGEEGVCTVEEYIKEHLHEGDILGFDGRVVSATQGDKYEALAKEKKASLYTEEDLVGFIWENRPKRAANPAWVLGEAYCGQSTKEKLAKIRKQMKEKNVQRHLLSSLCDIAWILNVRGSDIAYVPVVLSYLSIGETDCIWFAQSEAITPEVSDYLRENQIELRLYDDFYAYVRGLSKKERLLLDRKVVNTHICQCIPKECICVNETDPSVLLRAIKNETEQENIRKAHRKDAVAMCKFMYWLKSNVGKIPMTELSVAAHLEELRKQQEGFLELSFETISAYAAHGAIVHYAVTEETDVALLPENFLLVDSGAHYLEGTTDITRTFALGPITKEMREHFTRVCRANLHLARAVFLYGCTGKNLDILARRPLWEAQLDYKHGTGHGVGHLLCVHEGPNAFRWKKALDGSKACVLEEGMITTDEPGLYLEGQYGIRTENELLCKKMGKNEYGQFMAFEPLTFVPIDLDALDTEQMSAEEKEWLNAYHALVYEKVSPFLESEEQEFLKQYTRNV